MEGKSLGRLTIECWFVCFRGPNICFRRICQLTQADAAPCPPIANARRSASRNHVDCAFSWHVLLLPETMKIRKYRFIRQADDPGRFPSAETWTASAKLHAVLSQLSNTDYALNSLLDPCLSVQTSFPPIFNFPSVCSTGGDLRLCVTVVFSGR